MDIQLVRSFSTIDSVRRSMSLGWALLGWSIRLWSNVSISWVRYGRSLCSVTVNRDATIHLRANVNIYQGTQEIITFVWHLTFEPKEPNKLRFNCKWSGNVLLPLFFLLQRSHNSSFSFSWVSVGWAVRLTCPLCWSSSALPEHEQSMWEMSGLEEVRRKLDIFHPSLTSLHPDQNTSEPTHILLFKL